MTTLELHIEGGSPVLSVRQFTIREGVSELFSVSVVARSPRPDLDLDEAIFKEASFCIAGGWAFVQRAGRRMYTGLCESIEQIQAEPSGLSTYSIRLVPRLWLLTLRTAYRIFQRIAIPDIVTRLLDELRVPHTWRIDKAAHPRLEYKVQYGETDFAFLSRLCEEAGITFMFEGDEQERTVLVLSDAPCSAEPRNVPLPYVDNPNEAAEKEFVTRVRQFRRGQPMAVALRDYDFRNPSLPLLTEAAGASFSEGLLSYDCYEPGAFRVVTDAQTSTPVADKLGVARHEPRYGQSRAKRLLAGSRPEGHGVSLETNALDLAPGTVFSMTAHPHPALDESQKLLSTRFLLEGEHDKEWRARVQAVSADKPYHPPRTTKKPVVHGLQSAIITGPPGREVFTDEYGRVRVQFPWDREGKNDEASSCWIRVSQGWAGAGFGLHALPRVGQEVLVGFLAGDPDEPVIIGRAPNAHNPPPYPLPANETKTVWRSQSTPGADGFNEISFEDRKGEERLYERAEKDKETIVRNDERLTVGGVRQKLVKRGEDSVIAEDQRKVVGGGVHITVKGERRERVESSASDTVDGDRNERVCGRCGLSSGGQLHLSSDTEVVISGPAITLKGAGGFVVINEGGVALHGAAVTIMQGGAPGAGLAISPAPPQTPTLAATLFPTPPSNPVHLPVFGFGPVAPFKVGADLERAIICQAICNCESMRSSSGRKMAQQCVTTKLRQYDASMGGQSTIKAEVPYDMSQKPPAPIMSKNHPGPTTGHPKGSRIPDVILLHDGTKPPTQDNIKKVIEIKFPPDVLSRRQINDYPRIAGGAPFEVWGPDDPCRCEDKKKEPVPFALPIEDVIASAILAFAIVVMVLDDAIPGGQADDPLLPPLIAKLLEKLAPLLTAP
jgi:type VI secretion system secreted protein VgrG